MEDAFTTISPEDFAQNTADNKPMRTVTFLLY